WKTHKPERLLAGSEPTDWTGMTTTTGAVWIAAGARGVLRFSKQIGEKPQVIDVRGAALDVAAADGRLFVLVDNAGQGALVEVGPAGQPELRGRLDLPAVYQ